MSFWNQMDINKDTILSLKIEAGRIKVHELL